MTKMRRILFTVLTVLIICLSVYAAPGGFVYDSKGNRDPFVPLVTKGGIYVGSWQTNDLAEEITLGGIIYDPAGGSMAIINGTIVKEGDRLLNLKVLKIEKNRIIFLKGDKELIIKLNEDRGYEAE